jgi:hypothetical protein
MQATAEALARLWATQTAQAQSTAALISATPMQKGTAEPTHTPTGTAAPTNTPTDTPTPTPTSSPTPSCPIAVDPELAPAWDRASLGCPTADVAVIWAAWEPLEHGHLFWRRDLDWIYAFNGQGGSAPNAGDWMTDGESWRWDGLTNPPALTRPSGLFEPVRGFGFVWYYKLGGPSSQLGWATDEEKGLCASLQPFQQGFVFHSSSVGQCQDTSGAWKTPAPGLGLVFLSVNQGMTWKRY